LSVNTGINFINANTIGITYALIGLRLKATELHTIVQTLSFSLLAGTNDNMIYTLILNPTVAGTFTYADVTNSNLQAAIGAAAGTNTVTGGTNITSGMVAGNLANFAAVDSSLRIGSSIAGTLDTIVLCATPLSTGLDVYASLNWREFN